jgi:hypothetical protein
MHDKWSAIRDRIRAAQDVMLQQHKACCPNKTLDFRLKSKGGKKLARSACSHCGMAAESPERYSALCDGYRGLCLQHDCPTLLLQERPFSLHAVLYVLRPFYDRPCGPPSGVSFSSRPSGASSSSPPYAWPAFSSSLLSLACNDSSNVSGTCDSHPQNTKNMSGLR